MASRLESTQRRWLQHEAERRVIADDRIRLVWDAVDGGASLGETARAMSKAGKSVPQSYISKLLACGYPEG